MFFYKLAIKSNSISTTFMDLTVQLKCQNIITSPAAAVAKYCNEHVCVCVCVCVCLSVRLSTSISPQTTRTIFTKFLGTLPIAVARSSDGVTQSQE